MSLMDWFLRFWLRRVRYPWSRLRRRLCEGKYAQGELPSAGSLEEIAQCLQQVTWTMDGPLHLYDSVSYPQTVWAKKKDDCDGFAVLASEILKRWNSETEPALLTVMVRPARLSHTVCAFKEGEDVRFFNNASLDDGRYETYSGVVEKLCSDADRLVCWDVVDPTSLQVLEFHQG